MAKKKYDVFLSHNSKNKADALKLKDLLQKQALTAWIDIHELRPGDLWQSRLTSGIKASKSIAVLVGADGLGSWQSEEVQYALTLAEKDKRSVIGVLLPGAPELRQSDLPWAVQNRTIVDMRAGLDGSGLELLIWGIRGRKGDAAPISNNNRSDTEFRGTAVSHLDRRLYDLFKKSGSKVLDDYYSLLSLFSAEQPWESLDKFLEFLCSRSQEPGSIAYVNGVSGTGKSCLLGAFYLRQEERFSSNLSTYYPVLINLRVYIDEHSVSTSSSEESAKRFLAEAEQFCARAEASDLMLIVDGCEDYFRHPWQSMIAGTLRKFINGLTTQKRILKIIGYGQPDPIYPMDRRLDEFMWAVRDDIFKFERLPSEHPGIDAVLDSYCKLDSYDRDPISAQKMRSYLREHRVTDIDLFILSLLEQAIRKKWSDGGEGVAALYRNYCREYIRGPGRELLAGPQVEEALKNLAQEVFEFYVSGPLRSQARADGVAVVSESDGMRQFGLPHLHASVKEYLIAEHIVELICREPADDAHRQRYIYPYGINRFVRAIINRSVEMQKRVIAAIERQYLNSIVRDRIHLAYLLGRFEGDNFGSTQNCVRTCRLKCGKGLQGVVNSV
jgi:hypothetical protein